MKIVIRAGGTGTRLWPLSRKSFPKQFIKILSDRTMLQDTYQRIRPLLKDSDDLLISVNEKNISIIKNQIPDIKEKNIIVEPSMKNTGPALCLEAFFIKDLFKDDEVVIATLPSDDYINSSKAFCEMLSKAEEFLNKNPEYIVTPGTVPDTIDVGYSYIKTGRKKNDFGDYISTYEVEDWIEKPDYETCKRIIESGEYFYHTGMYIWKVKTVLQLFKSMQPKIYDICEEFINLKKQGKTTEAKKIYDQLESMSIETAIAHDAPRKSMIVSTKVHWSDVGKWYIFPKLCKIDLNSNVIRGNVIDKETSGSVIFSSVKNKVIATLDIQNLAIIDTEDALFISNLNRSGEVKDFVKELEERDPEKI